MVLVLAEDWDWTDSRSWIFEVPEKAHGPRKIRGRERK